MALPPPELSDQPQRAHELQRDLLRDRPALLGQLMLVRRFPYRACSFSEFSVIAVLRSAYGRCPES